MAVDTQVFIWFGYVVSRAFLERNGNRPQLAAVDTAARRRRRVERRMTHDANIKTHPGNFEVIRNTDRRATRVAHLKLKEDQE